MIDTFYTQPHTLTAHSQARRASRALGVWLAGLAAVAVLAGAWLYWRGPNPALLGWLLYLAGAAAILYRPRYGVYLLVGLALLGDRDLLRWYPFVRNFSSSESLLYTFDALIVSPAETYIVLTFVSWLGRLALQRQLSVFKGPLFWPAMIFSGFMAFGLVWGLGRGGNMNIGLWEARSIFYLPALLVLTSNLIETRAHVNVLLWAIGLSLGLLGFSGTWYTLATFGLRAGTVDGIAEHATSIHLNSFFVLIAAVWIFRASYAKRLVLPALLPFVLVAYLANQRRAAFVALAVALIVIAIVQYRESRTVFWLIAPLAAAALLIYLAAFWNSSGALGLPARSIKAIIAPDDTSARDYSSDLYRTLENINIQFTIRNAPLMGVGFGQKFYIVAPMADISFFTWWEYITHNSILWIWLKSGIGGFAALLVLVGSSVVVGVRAVWQRFGGDLSVAALLALLYIVMHFVFAYVDMSWDPRSTIYLGVAMGLLNVLERIAAQPIAEAATRWPWQNVAPPVRKRWTREGARV